MNRFELMKKVRQYAGWVLAIALAIVLSYFLARGIFPVPKIGIVKIQGIILPLHLEYVTPWLKYAQERRDIQAVVLMVSSPGGEASTSEELYYQVLALREEKPVVTSIDVMGASGAYHIAVASNYIFAKPASIIGSVGVRATLPPADRPNESTITTGPFKAPGSSQSDFVRKVDLIQESFLGEVLMQRGDKLELSKEELGQGAIYVGVEALQYGLVDALGSRAEAIEKAADYAGLTRYEVVDIAEEWLAENPEVYGFQSEIDLTVDASWPVIYHLYEGEIK